MIRKLRILPSLLLYRSIGMRLPHTFWPGGMLFAWIRKILLVGMGCRIGRGCEIEPHVDVGFSPRVVVGDNCQINQNVTLKTVVLGNDVMLAPGVVFLDRLHHFDRTDIPMSRQGESERMLTQVGDDVWIGQNAIIMPGVSIGAGVVVGAGAVVPRDVPPLAIIAGVPAKVLRFREES